MGKEQRRVGTLTLLTAADATTSAPSAASDGEDLNSLSAGGISEVMHLVVASTAGSDTMTVTLKLWLYDSTTAVWAPAGSSALATYTDASKGVINLGNALGETGTNTIRHREPVYDLHLADRVYLQVTAIGGTNTAISAWLVG